MNNKVGFSRITFLMMLSVFAASTFALTQYAKAERQAHSHVAKGMCKMCGMPKTQCTCGMKKEAPQKKWCDVHGVRDMCHLKGEPAAAAAVENGSGKQGFWPRTRAWFSATGARVKGWFKRSTKQGHEVLRDVTDVEFTELVKSGKPVVAKFHAVWCGTCKAMRPIDVQMQAANPDVMFVQIDIDKFGELAAKHDTKGVPTYVFYNKGGRKMTQVGTMTNEEFSKKVADLIK